MVQSRKKKYGNFHRFEEGDRRGRQHREDLQELRLPLHSTVGLTFNHHPVLNGVIHYFGPHPPTQPLMDHFISSSISIMDSLDPTDPLIGLVH